MTDSFTLIDFYTTSDKYLQNTKYYFDRNGFSDSPNSYSINDIKISSSLFWRESVGREIEQMRLATIKQVFSIRD